MSDDYLLEIGGFVPKGFKTTDPDGVPQHMRCYLTEMIGGYRQRTVANIKHSDGTIALASNFKSPGEVLTRNQCISQQKPYYAVDFNKRKILTASKDTVRFSTEALVELGVVTEWIVRHGIMVLNIAGNSESTCKGTYLRSYWFLKKLIGGKSPPIIRKIISGAQTGADQAGIQFAIDYNKNIERRIK